MPITMVMLKIDLGSAVLRDEPIYEKGLYTI